MCVCLCVCGVYVYVDMRVCSKLLYLSLWVTMWLTETSQQPISQTTRLTSTSLENNNYQSFYMFYIRSLAVARFLTDGLICKHCKLYKHLGQRRRT